MQERYLGFWLPSRAPAKALGDMLLPAVAAEAGPRRAGRPGGALLLHRLDLPGPRALEKARHPRGRAWLPLGFLSRRFLSKPSSPAHPNLVVSSFARGQELSLQYTLPLCAVGRAAGMGPGSAAAGRPLLLRRPDPLPGAQLPALRSAAPAAASHSWLARVRIAVRSA